MSRKKVDWTKISTNIGSLFIDSGAHSIYMKEVAKKHHLFGYDFYHTEEFWNYVDSYALFIKRYKECIDAYPNVDVIFNPELTYKVQKYLEEKWKLKPIPVLHFGTGIEWLKKYIDEGHNYIGVGGLGQEVDKWNYFEWCDEIFKFISPKPSYLPNVMIHGFAISSFEILLRYPWYSTDSASWVKAASFGMIYCPKKKNGKFNFTIRPNNINISSKSGMKDKIGRHYNSLSLAEKNTVEEWVEECGCKIGTVDKEGKVVEVGVASNHIPRKIVNLKYFQKLEESLPDWPRPFKAGIKKRKFEYERTVTSKN